MSQFGMNLFVGGDYPKPVKVEAVGPKIDGHRLSNLTKMYSVSQKKSPSIFSFFHKRLRIFNPFFTHLLYVHMHIRSQIFIQLSPTLTKLCHIERDYPVHIIYSKCPPSAETHAFRRLRKSLIALSIVICGSHPRSTAFIMSTNMF